MSLVLDSAGEEYVVAEAQTITAKPVTISAWVKSTTIAISQTVVCLLKWATQDEYLLLQLRGAVAGDPAAALEYATAWKLAESSTGYTVNTWHHIAATFVSSTERSVWIDGGSKITNTDEQNVNFTLLDRIYIGAHKVDSGFFDGKLAEVAIWNAELTDAQILDLANGNVPVNIESDNLRAYWKLLDSYRLTAGNMVHLTVGNGTPSFSSDHPSVIFNYPIPSGINFGKTIRRLVVAGNNEIWYENV